MKPLILVPMLILLAAISPVRHSAADSDTEAAQRITVPLTDPSRPATLKVSIVMGGITVEGYGGREVVVEAVGRAEPVHDRPPRGAEGMHRIPNSSLGLSADEDNNVVRVEARTWVHGGQRHIKVPFHSSLHLGSVNGGDLRVTGVDGELELANVNGSIEARDVAGSVVAHTTNGDVNVVLRRVDAGKPMAFSTLNGDINVTLPADLKADVRLSSDRGDIYSDFEIQARGRAAVDEHKGGRHRIAIEKELRGTISGGGPELLVKTFNGDIFLHRAKG
jgi:hypothetical protein